MGTHFATKYYLLHTSRHFYIQPDLAIPNTKTFLPRIKVVKIVGLPSMS